jgi:structural maintenance of chromosome 3 (chondroitin sulfate proteoglycan 6)
LIRRKDELMQALQEISVEDRKRQLNNCQNDLGNVSERIKKVNTDLEDVENKVNKAVKNQKAHQKDLESLMQKEKDLQDKIDQDSKLTEKWAAKENLFHTKIDECTEKISNLGALPQVEPQYTKMSLKKVSCRS